MGIPQPPPFIRIEASERLLVVLDPENPAYVEADEPRFSVTLDATDQMLAFKKKRHYIRERL